MRVIHLSHDALRLSGYANNLYTYSILYCIPISKYVWFTFMLIFIFHQLDWSAEHTVHTYTKKPEADELYAIQLWKQQGVVLIQHSRRSRRLWEGETKGLIKRGERKWERSMEDTQSSNRGTLTEVKWDDDMRGVEGRESKGEKKMNVIDSEKSCRLSRSSIK